MPLTDKQKEQKRTRAEARRKEGLCANCNNERPAGREPVR